MNPSAPVRKAPCLTAGSCASNAFEHTSSAELVRRLADDTPPSAEGGVNATLAASSADSSGETESLEGLEAPPRCGANPGRAAAVQADAELSNAVKVEELHTASVLESVSPLMTGEPALLEYLNVSALSQGPAQGERLSKAEEVTVTT